MAHLLALDVGGTFIKYGIADADGQLLRETVNQVPSCADQSAEDILDAFHQVIREATASYAIKHACVSTAGPFDFANGISLMKHKFPALYGHSIAEPFEQAGIPVTFLHDSTAFILGEYAEGTLKNSRHGCCVMLGTGLGFASMKDGKVAVNSRQTPAVILWNSPYLDGIAEDYVSTRAIQRLWGKADPVKVIADAARTGDARAIYAFEETGRHLSAILNPLLIQLGCDHFALGGQIAKSADLFKLSLPVQWDVSQRLDDAALLGACYYARYGMDACTMVIPE